jgi:4,5:9,10-diseco-3-hydroxy-5,9,17-trioxoandrosta-1(10),2-diene-4-oate hydrolase
MNLTSVVTRLSSGIEIHHHEAGAGRSLVFLHGGGPGASGLSNFQSNYAALAAGGYRVLMPDLPGWGQSSKPADILLDYAFLCGTLGTWLDTIGVSRCVVVGNALGGALALRLAMDQPARVSHLVLVAPAAIAPPEAYGAMPGMQALIGIVRGPRPIPAESMRKLFSFMYDDPVAVDDRVVTERTQAAAGQPDDLFARLALSSLQDRLHEITAPQLVFWGLTDRFCPWESSRNLLGACRAARLVTFAACGHWAHVEQATHFNRLTLDFLENG